MAYGLRYQCVFNNELRQDVTIYLLQKDYVGGSFDFLIADCDLSDSSDENTVIARELTFTIWADDNTAITWETFLAGSYDEWKVQVLVDGQYFFDGFLTPEEGSTPFLPKPYEVKLRATNGIKLLKDVALTDLAGDNFKGKFTLLEFLTAALQKTSLELPIRIYGSIYNEHMTDRGTDIGATYWDQVKMDHRSLMKDATTFVNCYDALVFMMGRHSRVFYWAGKWIVFYMPEHQYAPGGLFYTDFDKDGVLISGAEDVEGYSTVGKTELIYPINEDLLLSSSFPIKFAKTNYKYTIWPELPLNSKFERGTLLGTGTDADGNTYKDYSIDDWTSGKYSGTPTEFNSLPNFSTANTDPWYRRSTYNIYGVELRREVIVENSDGVKARLVQCEGIPVNKDDKVRFSNDWKADPDLGTGDPVPVQLIPYIVDDVTGDKYILRSKDGQVSEAKWELAGTQMIGIYTTPNGLLTDYQSINVESPAMPVNGFLYVAMLSSAQLGAGSKTYYKGFSMEYIPYIAGGFIPVSGDYWQHTQTPNQLDKDEADIKISDSVIRVLQGCFFNLDGVTATSPTWYRYGETESRHFKELVNLGRYNLGYRRFYRMEGTFTGLQYSPVNDPLNIQPLSYHKNYSFLDLPTARQFILTTPFSMNLATGDTKATFEEVFKDSADGIQVGDAQLFSYIFSN